MNLLFDVLKIWQNLSQIGPNVSNHRNVEQLKSVQSSKRSTWSIFRKEIMNLTYVRNLLNDQNDYILSHVTIASFEWILSNFIVGPERFFYATLWRASEALAWNKTGIPLNMLLCIFGKSVTVWTPLSGTIMIDKWIFSETVCFFVKSCANENDSGCGEQFRGNEILVLRNKEVVSKIERGFNIFDECFATSKDATFEFHAGGTDGVSRTERRPWDDMKSHWKSFIPRFDSKLLSRFESEPSSHLMHMTSRETYLLL